MGSTENAFWGKLSRREKRFAKKRVLKYPRRLTNVSWLMSPSGANMDCTINLWRFFSLGSKSKGRRLTENSWIVIMSYEPFGSHMISNETRLTWDLNGLFGVNQARIWLDTVPLRCRRLDLKANLAIWRIGEAHRRRNLAREWAWKVNARGDSRELMIDEK